MAKIMKIKAIAILSVSTILIATANAQQLPNEIQMNNIKVNLIRDDEP